MYEKCTSNLFVHKIVINGFNNTGKNKLNCKEK